MSQSATRGADRPGAPCLWCNAAFKAGGRGSKRRFCSSRCRTAFHTACRSFAAQAVLDGRLTVDAIRNAPQQACTLPTEANSPFPMGRRLDNALAR
jgi:hypothetical protein